MRAWFQSISPVYRFLAVFAVLSIVWYVLYTFVLKPNTGLDMFVVNTTLSTSKNILSALGHSVFVEGRVIRIAGTSGLWVGDSCNAIPLFALFAGFIISFPGNIKSKLWFIPTGILLIFLLNCIRMVALAIIDVYSRAWTEFNHTYTFTLLMYGFILLLWLYWINKYSFIKSAKVA